MSEIPKYTDVIVIGGGTAGAAIAGLLAESSGRSVLLLEAGPDYGALSEGKWRDDLLDARSLPLTHDWGYKSAAATGLPNHPLERARVIGGCSSHNGCAAIWGSRADYDAWAEMGKKEAQLRVRLFAATNGELVKTLMLDLKPRSQTVLTTKNGLPENFRGMVIMNTQDRSPRSMVGMVTTQTRPGKRISSVSGYMCR